MKLSSLNKTITPSMLKVCLGISFLASTLFAQGGLPSPDRQLEWADQMELFQSFEPKLAREDRQLYDKVQPLLQSNPTQAIAFIDASPVETRSPVFDFLLGNLLLRFGQQDRAEEALLRSVTKFPNFIKAHFSLAHIYASKNLYDQTEKEIQKIISFGGADGRLYGLLGYTHYQKGNYSSALFAYALANALESDYVGHRQGMLYSYVQLGKNEEIISLCDELIRIRPENIQLWSIQANALVQLKRPIEAMALLEIIDSKIEMDSAGLILLGRLYFNQELFNSAALTFTRAMLAGAELNTLTIPLQAMVRQGYYDEAEMLINTARTHYPVQKIEDDEMWRLCEVQLILLKDKSITPENELKVYIQKWPMNGSALMMLGRHLCEKGESDDGLFYFERAASIENVCDEAWRELARLALKSGETQVALKWLEKLDAQYPSVELKELMHRLRKTARD